MLIVHCEIWPLVENSLSLEEKINLIKEKEQGVPNRQLHSFIIRLKSKLTDALLDSNLSKQRSIMDFFKSSTVKAPTYVIK